VPILQEDVRIEDPQFYVNPFPLYARLRQEDPAYYREDLRMWVLTRYDDVTYVSKQPMLFSNRGGNLLADALAGTCLAKDYFAGNEFILTADPPRHNELRRLISPAFTPRRVAQMEDEVREFCRALVASIPVDERLDYISTVATILPLAVISKLLGLRNSTIDDLERWSFELMKVGQKFTEAERQLSVEVFSHMNEFMLAQFDLKRQQPAEDLLSTLLTAELDNEKISEENILMWASLVLAGGHETTRALIGNMVYALGTHPAQLEVLAADHAFARPAVEESLRWMTLAHGSVRAVSADTEFHERMMRQDDWVYMIFQAANRDPEVFTDPEVFDITTPRSMENLAFGAGQHFCPGNQLARLEARILIEELTSRFSHWEINAGTPISSTLRTGFDDLWVTFRCRS
jgi:cytochrome P450